ncbi:MAG: NAD-dependent epimerase/dehydratase family protein [Planctomycetota bacterium]
MLAQGQQVVGVDNLSPYYSVELKQRRIAELTGDQPAGNGSFEFVEADIADRPAMDQLFAEHEFDQAVHLAAQPGVRYSLENPSAYVDSNLVGFGNLLEAARNQQWKHFVFASSSSVYGANRQVPFSVDHSVDHPINLYAATKKANELMAHSYSHLFDLPTTGLRFFTVYGPWGRPDMAVWKFTEAILAGRPIDVYNRGQMERDFTYVDDIVTGVVTVLGSPPDSMDADSADPSSTGPNSAGAGPPYRIYNIGNNQPEPLEKLIATIESALGEKAERNLLPMQPGDMLRTYADIDTLHRDHGFQPSTPLEEGIAAFVDWYQSYRNE